MIGIGTNLQHVIEFGIVFTAIILGLRIILKFGLDALTKIKGVTWQIELTDTLVTIFQE